MSPFTGRGNGERLGIGLYWYLLWYLMNTFTQSYTSHFYWPCYRSRTVSVNTPLWLFYIAGNGLGYGLRFQSHSCSWQIRLESESDSMQCENVCIVQCSHWVWSLNAESESCSVNKPLDVVYHRTKSHHKPVCDVT